MVSHAVVFINRDPCTPIGSAVVSTYFNGWSPFYSSEEAQHKKAY